MVFFPNDIVHIAIVLVLLTWLQESTIAAKTNQCPIGFNVAYTKHRRDNPICYKLKGPETFAYKFQECAGNLYTLKLHYSLNITEIKLALWTDYKTLYPGGPFIDWSYTESTGHRLETIRSFKYDPAVDDDQSCLIIDPGSNFTVTKCNEKHYRYCFVKPYRKLDDMTEDGCKDLDGFVRFSSPKSICLKLYKDSDNGTVKARWEDARSACEQLGASVLNEGWRYANYPAFLTSGSNIAFPLNTVLSADKTALSFSPENKEKLVRESEWNFAAPSVDSDRHYGAVWNGYRHFVSSDYWFNAIICERSIQMKYIDLIVSVTPDNKIIMTANDTINNDDFLCFTDSITYYPIDVDVKFDDRNKNFILTPKKDGYYWCVIINSENYYVSTSNKALYIEQKESLINYYAVKLNLNTPISMNATDIEKYQEFWQWKVEQYIYYRTEYEKTELELDSTISKTELEKFKASHPWLVLRKGAIVCSSTIKRIIGRETVLLHLQLNPYWKAVSPGSWDDITVTSMKPVYYCQDLDVMKTLPLGWSTVSTGCRTFSCIGDFNEGTQWIITATSDCNVNPSKSTSLTEVKSLSNEEQPTSPPNSIEETPGNKRDESNEEQEIVPTPPPDTTEKMSGSESVESVSNEEQDIATTPPPDTSEETPGSESDECVSNEEQEIVPTPPPDLSAETPDNVTEITTTDYSITTPILPNEELEQLIADLELLLQNEIISVSDVDSIFDRLDNLIDRNDVDIPGILLQLLDELGSRIFLNGSSSAATIRSNIALVMADAAPDFPVRGLRLAARDDDEFTESAFEILPEEVNSSDLRVDKNDAVVHLPISVANSSRRISFVVFRTDRAFQSGDGYYLVNSIILSINVENVTKFKGGEVVDIHLSPFNSSREVDRNRSQSCAYWHFLEDETGYWSQEGCTFIRANRAGRLDTCRCDHLTHFAGILVPRSVFSERNENILEILTIIGCCLSIFGLFMVGLTALLFKAWRKDYINKIWLQLCIAIFLLELCFLVTIFVHFYHYNIPCMLIGIALHYSVLASFCWMLVAAIISYRKLVIVFQRDVSHKLLKASVFSWGAPCVVIGILLAVDHRSYAGQFVDKTPNGAFCFPSDLGLWLTVYAPIAAMLTVNWTIFILIVRSVFCASQAPERHGTQNETFRCATVICLLVFMFGLPWIFGLFAYEIVLAYLFTLTAPYQGFVLFVFFVLGNEKTRDLWYSKLKIKQTKKIHVTSSTYAKRSGGVGCRGDPEGAPTIEVNLSKSRSLASPDNSIFS